MSFGEDLKRLCEQRKADMKTVVRSTAIALQQSMIEKTPVDSGRLKGNFQVGVGSINEDTSSPPDKDGAATLARTAGALSDFRLGDTIYLTNSLPYAHVVEYGLFGKPPGSANGPRTINGYSSQTPAGFARLTAQEIREKVAAAVREIK